MRSPPDSRKPPPMPNKIAVAKPLHHAATKHNRYDAEKRDLNAAKFYKSYAWKKLRAAKYRRNPNCERCAKDGRETPTETIHHIQERLIRPDLALDMNNLESLCHSCHNREHKK